MPRSAAWPSASTSWPVRRLLRRPGTGRGARRVELALGVLGQRADRPARNRVGVPLAARLRRPAQGAGRLVGQPHVRRRLTALLAAITYGIQPYGGHVMGWTDPWVLAGL